jgi:hypothetical protein
MSILKQTEKPGIKSVFLNVPDGQEKESVTTFKNPDNVKYAELNCIVK